jgi:Cu-Zn family superoxide dismutase
MKGYVFMKIPKLFLSGLIGSVFVLATTSAVRAGEESMAGHKQAIAVIHGTTNTTCHGVVHFTQEGEDSVKVVADLEGLNPGQKHAFHIHQFGDCSVADATSAGSHYNPEGHQHGLPDHGQRHAGDLGNVQADSNGKAHYEITVSDITIAGAKNPIVGRGVIVHAKADDGSQPVGNAGGRIGCGVIGLANPQGKKP